MNDDVLNIIEISTQPQYLSDKSSPEQNRYVFAYTIDIHNKGQHEVQLLRRHWVITDGDGNIQEVRGVGVVGETPIIAQNSTYSYTSGTVFTTSIGYMEGNYTMEGIDGKQFFVAIPRFRLTQPNVLH